MDREGGVKGKGHIRFSFLSFFLSFFWPLPRCAGHGGIWQRSGGRPYIFHVHTYPSNSTAGTALLHTRTHTHTHTSIELHSQVVYARRSGNRKKNPKWPKISLSLSYSRKIEPTRGPQTNPFFETHPLRNAVEIEKRSHKKIKREVRIVAKK